ncbi:MAG TPA: type II toxin-antitoxin system VapC family toxin [Candidatus Kapabacteria bacterium]|nr:type II toxin-antitoxin system VapC family toxin [Candidatus Kapabacteria bacterium]
MLDTNAAIAFLNGDTIIASKIDRSVSLISVIVMGELLFGALNSSRVTENVKRVMDFVANADILFVDTHTSRLFGEIKASLQKKGRLIPDNDIWIAATSLQHGLELVTRDGHFQQVENLRCIGW